MGPPAGRARSPPGLGPHNCRGPGDTLPQKDPRPASQGFGRPVSELLDSSPHLWAHDIDAISQRYWIIEVSDLKGIEASPSQRVTGP